RAWFEVARWPNGVRCPRCSSDLVRRLSTRPSQFNCRGCRYRFSVTSGTPLHGTHLPLKTWLLAMYLMATSTRRVSARRLSLWLGIGYRSAWHLAHRIRALMAADPLLGKRIAGIVETDETRIGGKPRKRNGGPQPQRKRISGRGDGKPCVLVASIPGTGTASASAVSGVNGESMPTCTRPGSSDGDVRCLSGPKRRSRRQESSRRRYAASWSDIPGRNRGDPGLRGGPPIRGGPIYTSRIGALR